MCKENYPLQEQPLSPDKSKLGQAQADAAVIQHGAISKACSSAQTDGPVDSEDKSKQIIHLLTQLEAGQANMLERMKDMEQEMSTALTAIESRLAKLELKVRDDDEERGRSLFFNVHISTIY